MRVFLPVILLLIANPLLAEEVDFNQDVRPILSDKCYKCHGPDAKNQKSEFRVDTFEHATADLGGYAGIVPGDLDKSDMHWRLHTDDSADLMPPPESKIQLSKEEIDILDQWVKQGAPYAEHWAFTPLPEEVPVPEVKSDWVKNDIDRFIFAKLEKKGFPPSPETTREKWLRRVTFDLTGLPPTVADIDRFLADTSPDAYEKVVDNLLDTDASAERLAMEWMNVARYSDSYGFQVDRDRTVWQWRDWLIRSFRNDLPYDQFITWQLAGDLLPNATRDQILATTFNRLHAQKVEGGSVPEEFRIEYVSDRVETYGTAFLGMTMQCCRCHDHKYDPVTQKDYFQLSAFFDNIDEAGLYSFFTPAVPTPTLWLPTEEQEKELKSLQSQIAESEKALAGIHDRAKTPYQAGSPSPLPKPVAEYSFDTLEKDKLPSSIEGQEPAKTSTNNKLVPGHSGQAIHLTGDDAVTLPVGNFTRDDSFSVALWMNTPDVKERAVVFSRSKAWTDAASRGYELLLEDGKLSFALIHFYPGNALRVKAKDQLPVGQWKHVTVTYDGSSRADGVGIYVDGKPIALEVVRDKLTREITGGGSDNIVIGERMRDNGFKNGLVDDFAVFDRELSPSQIAAVFENKQKATRDLDSFLTESDDAYRTERQNLTALRKKRSELVKKISEIMVMKEMPTPHQTYLLGRGQYTNREEPVSPATPAFLPAMPEDAPKNRLGLARWTVSEDNPLTPRVTVNRYWQMLFGTGLVATTEDFGSQGRPPTHPKLLDWLARDFVDSGWDLRHLLKGIVLSATYRQQSHVASGELASLDPENTLLYRYPAPRLSAEMIRDNALAVSGLLVKKVGGPSVKPYEIAVSFKPSKPDTGENLYRRSLYTYWKQTAPAPLMTTLNASKRDVCRVRLEKTDTPLQGLVLLNSPQFVEAARTLAAKLVEAHGDDSDAILKDSFRRLTSREPDSEEWAVLKQLLSEQEDHFSQNEEAARELLKTGDSPAPECDSPAQLAAVTNVVTTLMNFDECISKR